LSHRPHLGSPHYQALRHVEKSCARLQYDGPPRGYRRSALRSWCRMHVRVDQGGSSEHVCSTKGRGISEGYETDSTSTYIPCHFRIAFLFINCPGVLRGCLNRTGHLSRYSLIRAKSFGTNRGIERPEVTKKAIRDSLFGCRELTSNCENDTALRSKLTIKVNCALQNTIRELVALGQVFRSNYTTTS
jgi:hypothetical protein